MSADSWRICPRCHLGVLEQQKARAKALDDAYGNVVQEEYLRMVEEAKKPIEEEETLREDFEIGIDIDGKFFALYRSCCKICGFGFQFDHREHVPIPTGWDGRT